MSCEINKVLAVVDPTTGNQRAQIRALHIARRSGACVCAFLICHSSVDNDDEVTLRRVEIVRHRLWLEHLFLTMDTARVELTSEVVWDKNWRDSSADAAVRNGCDAAIKSTYGGAAAAFVTNDVVGHLCSGPTPHSVRHT